MPWDLHHPRPTELMTQKHFPSIRRLKKDRVQRPWKPDETGQVKSKQMSHSWVTWAWKIQEREMNRTDSTSLFILFCFYWKDIVWQIIVRFTLKGPKFGSLYFIAFLSTIPTAFYRKRVRIRRSARQQKAQDFSGDSLVLRQVEKFRQSCWFQLILPC